MKKYYYLILKFKLFKLINGYLLFKMIALEYLFIHKIYYVSFKFILIEIVINLLGLLIKIFVKTLEII